MPEATVPSPQSMDATCVSPVPASVNVASWVSSATPSDSDTPGAAATTGAALATVTVRESAPMRPRSSVTIADTVKVPLSS